MKYPGYNFLWNPNTPLSKEKISETEFLLFQFPKDKTPLQMRFYYYYKPDPPYRGQKKWAQIDIDLVLRDEY